jgi:CBS domain-containing protein
MGLCDNLCNETVNQLPLREVIAIAPSVSVRDAVAKMREKGLGCAVIVGSDGKPQGIFTERSVIELLATDGSLTDRAVGDFADSRSVQVKNSEPISRVWDAVQHDGHRFVCVTDPDGKLVGLTGQRGLSEYVSEHFPRQVMVNRLGGKGWSDQREGA